MASPSNRRATKRRRSSITELAFHGIHTSRPQKAKSVTHVSGTECHPCLGPLIRPKLRWATPMKAGACRSTQGEDEPTNNKRFASLSCHRSVKPASHETGRSADERFESSGAHQCLH